MDDQFINRRHRQIPRPEFKTPDQVAAINDESSGSPLIKALIVGDEHGPVIKSPMKKRSFTSFIHSKRGLFLIISLVIVLAGVGVLIYRHYNSGSLKLNVSKINSLSQTGDKTVASDLSGLQVNPSVNKLPVTAVMVENSLAARPQAGLSQAMVVFEAVEEGGVTRFMALYQDTSPSNVGPIRSARPYYISWALGFDAGYSHVGGSPDALTDIASWNVRDLDQFYNGSYYTRVTYREAPHNVYTSISELNQLEFSKGYDHSTFTVWPRKKPTPLAKPKDTSISMDLSGPDYNPTYTYSKTTNSYDRDEDGAPQIDANTNTQISPKVVIAIVVPETQGALDSTGAYYSDYNVIGSGTAYVFQDGGLTIGQWTKSSNNAQILFTENNGKALDLNPGQVWITAITAPSNVSYN